MPDWLAFAQALPRAPGVYTFRGTGEEVLYVGKAKDLRARVAQYFQDGRHDVRLFIDRLSTELEDIDTAVTRSEKEALILERELIRKYEPRYNVIWRDDKQYLCLRVDTSHAYPWVQVVRHMKKDGARYFGPFHRASAARQTLRVVNRHFQLRTCRDSVLNSRTRPCLEYQLGRCPAPCVYDVDKEAYQGGVDDALMFLEGKADALLERLNDRMWKASEAEAFEVAARLRDQVRAVEKTLERQHAALPSMRDQDVIGLFCRDLSRAVAVLEVRGGRIRDVRTRVFDDAVDDERLLESFLLQYYESSRDIPGEVVVPMVLEGADALGELLTERREKKVVVLRPFRGERLQVLDLARSNAEHAFYEERRKTGAMLSTLETLKKRLHLKKIPRRIECFDISHFQGSQVVASGVHFAAGLPDKSRYRRYRIQTVDGQDDFKAMYEVVARRLRRGLEARDLPDLLVVDGGKGQLRSATAAMDDLDVQGVDVISLAKSRTEDLDAAGGRNRSPERVFLVSAREPVVLGPTSAELKLLAALRDEAHRFAVTFHESLRRKEKLRSGLEDVPGIGPELRKRLLKHFGSLKRVRSADLSALEAVPGVGRKVAEQILGHFRGEDA